MRIIVNADDCGMSAHVNNHIENAILSRKITSTTVMANMDDLEGAKRLYEAYKDTISFGLHMNLTQGHPLLYSQSLLDCGFYKESEDGICFNGYAFMRRFLNRSCCKDILKELQAQANVLRDNQIAISHIDSHHHIHTAFFMMGILPCLSKSINVYKVRNMRNFMPLSVNKMVRNIWRGGQKIQNWKLRMTDYMCSYEDFYKSYDIVGPTSDKTIELMCHPGHDKFAEEENKLLEGNLTSVCHCEMISYNEF